MNNAVVNDRMEFIVHSVSDDRRLLFAICVVNTICVSFTNNADFRAPTLLPKDASLRPHLGALGASNLNFI